MRGGVNYAALNVKIRAMAAGISDAHRIVGWLPFGCVRDFVTDWAEVPSGARDVPDYIRLWKRAQGLDRVNRRALLPMLGTEIDLRNIIWLYRLRTYHGVGADAVFGQLIPIRWRLTQEALWQMAEAKDESALLACISQGPYRGVFLDFKRPERAMGAALSRIYKKTTMAHRETVAGVCAFLFTESTKKFVCSTNESA